MKIHKILLNVPEICKTSMKIPENLKILIANS